MTTKANIEPCSVASGFSGYFDDAGKVGNTASLVVGGFVGAKEQWERLIPAWEQVLTRNGIRYFHGVECEHGNKEFNKTATPRWSDPKARSACRMEFVDTIIQVGLTGIVAGVVSKDYTDLDNAQRDRLGKPFSMAAQTLVVVVKDWANERHVYELISYVFENGSEGRGEFEAMFKKAAAHDIKRDQYRMKSYSVVGKECIPAQAADLIAYEYSHCLNTVANSAGVGFERPAVKELEKRLTIKSKYLDTRGMLEVLSKPKSSYEPFKVRRSR